MIAKVCIVFVALLALVGAESTSAAQATDFATDTSSLVAKIVGTDGKPLEGVRLLAYHLSSERLYTSEPTKKNGECAMHDLPYGYHDLAVETPDGLYVSTQVVNIPPDSTAAVVLSLLAGGGAESAPRSYPGSEIETVGMARLVEKLRGRAFWKSPRGIAVLAGSGGLLLLLLAGGGGGGDSAEVDVSPFTE